MSPLEDQDVQSISELTPHCGPHCGTQNGMTGHCSHCHTVSRVKDNQTCPHGLHFNGTYCEECNP